MKEGQTRFKGRRKNIKRERDEKKGGRKTWLNGEIKLNVREKQGEK